MKIIDPGHLYDLDLLDADIHGSRGVAELRFVKRIGDRFPGNTGPAYEGTTTQEVLRALIDRTKYVDNQKPDRANSEAIWDMRNALKVLEMRAARERGDVEAERRISTMVDLETEPTCSRCGHILCERTHE